MLHVRAATPSDREVVIGFIDEASGWLATKGTDQWARPWPNEAERNGRVDRGIADGCTWMVEDDGEIVGTISCRPEGNPRLWHDKPRDPAVYVSRLIVRRSHSGQGIGNELFDWAGYWAARQYGARWIRIDVWTTNTMLHNYYEKRGFSFAGVCDDVDYPSARLFQKDTGEISRADLPRLTEEPRLKRPDRRAGRAHAAPASAPLSRLRRRLQPGRPLAAAAAVMRLASLWRLTAIARQRKPETGSGSRRRIAFRRSR